MAGHLGLQGGFFFFFFLDVIGVMGFVLRFLWVGLINKTCGHLGIFLTGLGLYFCYGYT